MEDICFEICSVLSKYCSNICAKPCLLKWCHGKIHNILIFVNNTYDLLDVFGRTSSVISTGTSSDPSILSPTLCINPSTNDSTSSNFSEDSVNLVYFNEANKAMKNTTPNANIKLSVQDIEIQHGITDLNEDLKDILGNNNNFTNFLFYFAATISQ